MAPLPTLLAQSPAGYGDGAHAGPGVAFQPAEVDGQPITAAHVRELLEQLDAVCPGGLQAPTGGSLTVAVTDVDGVLLATASRAQLEGIARRGCPQHPAGDEPLAGAGNRHGTPADSCDCAVLRRPAPVDRYTPTPAQRRT